MLIVIVCIMGICILMSTSCEHPGGQNLNSNQKMGIGLRLWCEGFVLTGRGARSVVAWVSAAAIQLIQHAEKL